MAKLTPKQKMFVEEYLIDLNATQAAIRAGYSEKTAYSQGERLLKNVEVKNWIDEQLAQMQGNTIADAKEVMEYLTSVLRGESRGTELVIESVGDYMSEAREVEKAPSEKEKLKAAELLAKRYGLLTDKVNLESAVPVVIVDDVAEDS